MTNMKSHWLLPVIVLLFCTACNGTPQSDILVGASRMEQYLPMVKNNRIGITANHTSIVGNQHLVDTLLSKGIQIVKIYSPEHGFRGKADAGSQVADGRDSKTGIPLLSLYGKNKKPSSEMLKGIDIMLFDLQDVGVRFYTYISTLTYVMEACAEEGIPVIVLDRPNPNGFYIDGPVLEPQHRSFVGLHPVPVVYGMTIGEYATMVNGEQWMKNGIQCDLTVIKLKGYHHQSRYTLPVKPSPNLPDMESVYLYPSLCFFEGTVVSVGRGTPTPFRLAGHPKFTPGTYRFTPISTPGASLHPKLEGKTCTGYDLSLYAHDYASGKTEHLNLHWLIEFYKELHDQETFFKPFFTKLAGTTTLQEQITKGRSEKSIREGWQKDIEAFKKTRSKYLLYAE